MREAGRNMQQLLTIMVHHGKVYFIAKNTDQSETIAKRNVGHIMSSSCKVMVNNSDRTYNALQQLRNFKPQAAKFLQRKAEHQ